MARVQLFSCGWLAAGTAGFETAGAFGTAGEEADFDTVLAAEDAVTAEETGKAELLCADDSAAEFNAEFAVELNAELTWEEAVLSAVPLDAACSGSSILHPARMHRTHKIDNILYFILFSSNPK